MTVDPDTLRRLWENGLPKPQIARRLGITGHRLELLIGRMDLPDRGFGEHLSATRVTLPPMPWDAP